MLLPRFSSLHVSRARLLPSASLPTPTSSFSIATSSPSMLMTLSPKRSPFTTAKSPPSEPTTKFANSRPNPRASSTSTASLLLPASSTRTATSTKPPSSMTSRLAKLPASKTPSSSSARKPPPLNPANGFAAPAGTKQNLSSAATSLQPISTPSHPIIPSGSSTPPDITASPTLMPSVSRKSPRKPKIPKPASSFATNTGNPLASSKKPPWTLWRNSSRPTPTISVATVSSA